MPKERPLPKHARLIPKTAKKVFSGEIFDVYQWPQKMFDGSKATFEMLKRPDTVSVIGVIEEKIVLLRQQQPDSEEFWSLPGGRVEPNEDIFECAKRETLEETGIEFKDFRLVHVKQLAHKIEGFLYTFVANGVLGRIAQNLDSGEKIDVHELPYEEVLEMVRRNENEVGHVDYLREKIIQGKYLLKDILADRGIA